MSYAENPVYSHKAITASTVVKPGAGVIHDLFVSAASNTPVITVCDDADTGSEHPIVGPFTPVAGTAYQLHRIMERGVTVIVSGTVNVSVGFQ